jgi:hypothetical protein
MVEVTIPYEIQSYINSNLSSFSASIYLRETDLDLCTHLSKIKEKNFPHFSFKFNCKKLLSIKSARLYMIEVSKISVNINHEESNGYFFLIEDIVNDAFVVITPDNKRFLKRVVHLFMQTYLYGAISRVYITSKDIYDILNKIEEDNNIKLFTRWCTGKRLFSQNPDTIIKFVDKLIPFDEAFEQAQREKMNINWIQIESKLEELDESRVKFSISRSCDVTSSLKNINLVYIIFGFILSKGKLTQSFLKGREIKPNTPARPIVLGFREKLLEDLDRKKKLIETFDKYKKCNYSVIHGGNPHIYLYISDRLDKSSYSIRSVGSDKILIIPLLKSTYSSLIRFIEFLSENFTEYESIKEIVNG